MTVRTDYSLRRLMTNTSINQGPIWTVCDRCVGIAAILAVMVLTMLLSGCRSSPVSPVTAGGTVIRYSIPSTSHVNFSVKDSYNTTVATLVDSVESAGVYSVTWNTVGYPAGIYFYYLSVTPLDGGKGESLVKEVAISG